MRLYSGRKTLENLQARLIAKEDKLKQGNKEGNVTFKAMNTKKSFKENATIATNMDTQSAQCGICKKTNYKKEDCYFKKHKQEIKNSHVTSA